MVALIILSDPEDIKRIEEHFDDYEILQLGVNPEKYYEESRKVRIAKDYYPVFHIPSNPVLASIVTFELLNVIRTFYIVEWTGTRYRPLKIP